MIANEPRAKKAPRQHPDIPRLCTAIQRARIMLRRYRSERREAVRQYVGHHWSEESTREKVPLNLLSLYCQVVGQSLIAKNPRVMFSTFDESQKAAVKAMQSWANRELVNMRFSMTARRVVLDALFSVGICKVALATPAEGARVAWNLAAGKPFAERVDLDDFVFDMYARDFTEVGYIGHRFRVPLEVIRDSKLYAKKPRESLSPSEDRLYNLEGDERIGVLGRGTYAGNYEEYEDFVDLWEIYLPRKRLVLTLADDSITGASGSHAGGEDVIPLREQEWVGPDTGPYHMLCLQTVPGNAMPKGPIMDLVDLHEAANHVLRKLIRQAQRQKEVLGIAGGAMEDGARIMEANDGDIIREDNPERAQMRMFGGPNQQNIAFFLQLKDLFSYMGGNLELLGGRGPQSKTATQDTMLNQNAGAGVSDLAQTTTDFVAEVVQALAWYWWHDPQTVMKTVHHIPGMPEMAIHQKLHPFGARDQNGRPQRMRRQAKFTDLDIKVDPYSMQHQTPQMRAQALNALLQQVLPLMPLMQQQGIGIDLHTYFTKQAAYMDMPDLPEVISIQPPPDPQGAPRPAEGGMAPETTRNYVRRSLGGNTPENREATLMNGVQQNSAAQAQTNGASREGYK